MVDVTIVNNSDQTVTLRIDDSTVRGQEAIEHYKKMARQGDFESIKVAPTPSGEPAAPEPEPDEPEPEAEPDESEPRRPAKRAPRGSKTSE